MATTRDHTAEHDRWRQARNNRESFNALYSEYAPSMHRAAWQVTHNEETAWDIVQQAFLKAIQSEAGYGGRGSIKGWLIRIARNTALDQWRQRKRRDEQPLGDQERADDQGPEYALIADEGLRRVARAMEHLSADEREMIRLHVQEDLTYQEMADILGRKTGAIRVAIHRIRKKLAAGLEEEHA